MALFTQAYNTTGHCIGVSLTEPLGDFAAGTIILTNGRGWEFFVASDQFGVLDLSDITPPAIRVKRPLLEIITALNALSAAKKTAVWNDISSGSPPKWALDDGQNAAAIAVLQLLATTASFSAADLLTFKIRGVAMYCQDKPQYLVNPAFDPTIDIPGDQPAS